MLTQRPQVYLLPTPVPEATGSTGPRRRQALPASEQVFPVCSLRGTRSPRTVPPHAAHRVGKEPEAPGTRDFCNLPVSPRGRGCRLPPRPSVHPALLALQQGDLSIQAQPKAGARRPRPGLVPPAPRQPDGVSFGSWIYPHTPRRFPHNFPSPFMSSQVTGSFPGTAGQPLGSEFPSSVEGARGRRRGESAAGSRSTG